MKGSKTPDHPTDQQCQHCGRWYSSKGIKPHERNCQYKDEDFTLVSIDESQETTDKGNTLSESPTPKGFTPSENPADVERDTPEPTGDTPESTVTDGGTPMDPPEPDVEDDRPDQDETQSVPDRYMNLEEYIREFEAQNPETARSKKFRSWKQKARQQGDYVDTERTTSTHIEVVSAEEVRA
jgi:hypothetical protein